MILDYQTLFDTAAALTTSAASTNIYDMGVAKDFGIGDDPPTSIDITVTTTFQSTGSSTLVISYQGSTDNSTWDTYMSTPAIAKANLAAGAKIKMPIPRPQPGQSRGRYFRLYYTVGVADFTAGALTAALVLDQQANIAYPAGINISN